MTVVGTCRSCGERILAPVHTLVEVSGRTFHLECHQRRVLAEMRQEVATGRVPRDPAAA